MRNTLLLLIPALFILSCTEKNSLPVSPYVPGQPASPHIDRDTLVRNNSYQQAYLNGTIRSTRAVISWQQSTDPDFLCYRIFRDKSIWVRDIDSAQRTWLLDSLLQQNTWYQYTVSTVLRNGRSKVDTVTIRTPRFLPPALFPPRVDTTGTIFLSWINQAETAQKIMIERKLNGAADLTYQKVAELEATEMMFRDVPLAATYSYIYRLSAWNKFERTACSQTSPVLYSMTAPTLLSANQIGVTYSVKVSFADNSNAETGFKIYRKRVNGSYAVIGRAPANATEFIDTDSQGLASDGSFYYKVECYNREHSNASSEMLAQLFMKKVIELSPPALQFLKTNIGYSDSLTLTIRNTGTSQVTVSNVVSSNPRFVPSRTSFAVPAGSSTTLSITFTPTDTLVQSGTITVITNPAVSVPAISVTGSGASAPVLMKEDFEGGTLPSGWTTSGSSGWFATGDSAYQGSYSMRSGSIPHAASTTLSKTIAASGLRSVSFRYRVSSETGHDHLKFYINGNLYGGPWSGETGWQWFYTYFTGTGTAALSWTYSKDGSGTGGTDQASIDNVIVQ